MRSYSESRFAVAPAAVLFLGGVLCSILQSHQYVSLYGTPWSPSDDQWYLEQSQLAVAHLRQSHGDYAGAWTTMQSAGSEWTLLAWPYAVALVHHVLGRDEELVSIKSTATLLAPTLLCLTAPLAFAALRPATERQRRLFPIVFVLLMIDPMVYSGINRKESLMQFGMLLSYVTIMRLSEKFRIRQLVALVFALCIVITTRPANVGALVLAGSVLNCKQSRFNFIVSRRRLAVYLSLAACVGVLAYAGVSIRGIPFSQWFAGGSLPKTEGLGYYIYSLPVLGPWIFYAVAPTLPSPFTILDREIDSITLIRGFGGAAWAVAASLLILSLVRRPWLLLSCRVTAPVIMWSVLFTAAVLQGDDPRYKQPASPFLAIALISLVDEVSRKYVRTRADRSVR